MIWECFSRVCISAAYVMNEDGSLFFCFFPGIFVKHILSAFFNQVNFLSLANGRIIEDTSGAFHLRRFEAFFLSRFLSAVCFMVRLAVVTGGIYFATGRSPGRDLGTLERLKVDGY